MTIDEFRALIGPVAERFSQAYPKHYLNKIWPIWRQLPALELKRAVDEINQTQKPVALEVWGHKVANRLSIRIKPEHESEEPPAPRMEAPLPTEQGFEDEGGSTDPISRSVYSKRLAPGVDRTMEMLKEQDRRYAEASDAKLKEMMTESGAESLWDLVQRKKRNPK